MSGITQANLNLHRLDAIPTNTLGIGEKGAAKVFQTDQLVKSSLLTIEPKQESLSIFQRLSRWIFGSGTVEKEESAASTHVAKKPEPIDHVPELEIPKNFPPELDGRKLPPVTRNSRQTVSQGQIFDGLSNMSDKTLEQILFIVMKGQLELQKENVNVAENTYTSYQNMRKLREKVLEEIKDTLEKDQKFLAWAKTGQNIALAAQVVCTIAIISTKIATAYALPPFGILIALGAFAPYVAGDLTVLAKGATTYAQRCNDLHEAKHEEFKHNDKTATAMVEEGHDRVMAFARSDEGFKEHMIKHLNKIRRMNQSILE